MIDTRYFDSMICKEMPADDQEHWFSCTKKKFLHNIDTFYYSVKFKQDFRSDTKDKYVLGMRRYFKYLYDSMGYGDTSEIRLKDIDKRIVLKPITFSRFYTVCLSYPEYFDIFLAPVVPKSLDGGQSVTCECIVQIRSYMLWMFGIHAAFENSYRYIKALAAYFHLDVDLFERPGNLFQSGQFLQDAC